MDQENFGFCLLSHNIENNAEVLILQKEVRTTISEPLSAIFTAAFTPLCFIGYPSPVLLRRILTNSQSNLKKLQLK